MLLLTSTSDVISVITSTAANIDVHASWVDSLAPSTITPGRTNTAIAAAATTTVVAAPAASTQRNVQTLNIRNKHATTSNLVTIRHFDGTVTAELFDVTLLAGEELSFMDGVGFRVIDVTGATKTVTATGRYLGTSVLTAGTTFTTSASTNSIFIRVQGGGGGGGGCSSLGAAAAAAGGGGGGGYAEKTFAVTPSTNYTYAIGAAGAGVSNAAGANGGNSTFAVGATTVTAFGGTGGPVATAATTLTTRAGGAGGVVSTNGDLNSAGMPGNYGVVLIVATPIVAAGCGGSSDFGGGGLGIVAVGNGNNGAGFGGGGGGSATGAAAVRTGGNGTAGVIIVDQYA